MTTKEKNLLDLAKLYLPGGSNGNAITMDVIIEKGLGPKVWDIHGNEYIDYSLGSGPMLLGHSHPEVVDAVSSQITKGTTYFGLNKHMIDLAEEIISAVPCAESIRFANSGSEATFFAMRAARAFTQKEKILKFEGGFHGMSDYALMSMMPGKPQDFPIPTPDCEGIPESIRENVLIAPYNNSQITKQIIEKNHNEIGGIIVEPIQRVIPPKIEFLQSLRELATKYKIPLIFDEIVTGFRLDYGGAQTYYGVTPDICTLGKALSGGFPISAITGKKEIMEYFSSKNMSQNELVLQEGTMNGNPLCSIAALTTLKILKRPNTYKKLKQTGSQFIKAIKEKLFEFEIPAQITGEFCLFDIVFQNDPVVDYRSMLNRDKIKTKKLNKSLLDQGIYKNHSKYYLSTSHSEKEIEKTIDAIQLSFQKI